MASLVVAAASHIGVLSSGVVALDGQALKVSSIVRAVILEMLSDDVLLIEVEALIVKRSIAFMIDFLYQ